MFEFHVRSANITGVILRGSKKNNQPKCTCKQVRLGIEELDWSLRGPARSNPDVLQTHPFSKKLAEPCPSPKKK